MDGGPFPLFQDMYLHVQCKKVKVVSNAKRINLQNYQKIASTYVHFLSAMHQIKNQIVGL